MTKAETQTEELQNFVDSVSFSPEAAVQDRIAKFRPNLLTRLAALDEMSEADFDLAA